MNRQLRWAATTLLEMVNFPATPDYINAFNNPTENQQWIYSLIRAAQPQIGAMTSPYYNQAIEILEANGISVNPYNPGGG